MTAVSSSNLLPPAIRCRRVRLRGFRRWGLVLAVVAAGLAAFVVWHTHLHVQRGVRIEAIRAETAPLLQAKATTVTHRKRIADATSRFAERERLVPREDTIEVLDLVGRACAATRGELSVDSLRVERERVPGGEAGVDRHATRVEVGGVAVSDVVLSRFVAALRREVEHGRVELQSAGHSTIEGKHARTYVVVCSFD